MHRWVHHHDRCNETATPVGRHPILETGPLTVLRSVHGPVHDFQSLDCRPLEWSDLVQNRSGPASLLVSDWTAATLVGGTTGKGPVVPVTWK